MGQVDGCLPCKRVGWDYAKNGAKSVVRDRGVFGVQSVDDCIKICNLSHDCYFVRYVNPVLSQKPKFIIYVVIKLRPKNAT